MQTQVSELLNRQKESLKNLMALLTRELDAFKLRQPQQIEELNQQKVVLLQQIESLDKSIEQLPELAALKQQDEFIDAVAEIQTLLADVKSQNQINERVIRTSLGNLQRLKQKILSLKNHDAMTYDKLGQAQSQTLGKGIKA
ncbi:flagellar export chaperone FlgN [Gayadomonas joobiniege]|uniref:flagellar export chaperone FlgN n=1 Tax=Gayadomonas joobiniege TaxID=1234606 RepID=UPI00037B77C0|nr:flagellar export chaperone FlgN [Gayadomonas joobiniege]